MKSLKRGLPNLALEKRGNQLEGPKWLYEIKNFHNHALKGEWQEARSSRLKGQSISQGLLINLGFDEDWCAMIKLSIMGAHPALAIAEELESVFKF